MLNLNTPSTPIQETAETGRIDWLHDRAGLTFAAVSALGPYVLAFVLLAVVGPLFGLNG